MKCVGILTGFIVLLGCQETPKNTTLSENPVIDSTQYNVKADDPKIRDTVAVQTLKKEVVFGYRFVIAGDFDGDGSRDTLKENLIDKKTGKAAPKFLDYGSMGMPTPEQYGLKCFLTCDSIPPFDIKLKANEIGLNYLNNEGDLDGDGGDEVSYALFNQEWYMGRTIYVISCKSAQWKPLFQFMGYYDLLPEPEAIAKKKTMGKLKDFIEKGPDGYIHFEEYISGNAGFKKRKIKLNPSNQ